MSDFNARLQQALGDAYRVERELGGGGMSRVFVATESALDRHVVIKVLPPELAAGLNVDRFRREIQLAAKLQHPHIVPLLAAGSADGLLYYTMPLIEGESLRIKLAREGELPVAEAMRILREVADALAYAHAHGLIHRDIKPDNVLLSGKHAVVTDFGVSKALSNATGGSDMTSIGVALGTPAYMAPEQAAADPTMDHRADIYALGVLAYELLAGRPPFSGNTAQQVMAAHATQTPQPLTQARAAVPPALEALVLRCLEKRPADRPRTAADVLGALEGMATPSGGMAPFAPASSARRRLVLGGVGAAIIVAGALAFATLRGPRAAAAGTRSIAVLPFETLGGSDSGLTLADGLQDDILTQLTKIGALQVTSRRSVQDYRHTTKNVREIGRELGVRALLTGQVQRAGNRMRVNVQLIEAGSDRQLWAEAYDRELTAQHVFAIQDSIAKNVAEALRIELSPAEAQAIAETPTQNLEALDYFHRGRELFNRRGFVLADTEAPRAFERAVALDPQFAQAWAGLSEARSWLIRQYLTYDTTPARRALERAEALAPDAPETELARGFYQYYAKGEYAAALEHFRAVERTRPSDGGAVQAIGYIMRRQGDTRGALEHGERITQLDPRDPSALWDLGGTYLWLRRFAPANRALERALILYPDYESATRLSVREPVQLGRHGARGDAGRECGGPRQSLDGVVDPKRDGAAAPRLPERDSADGGSHIPSTHRSGATGCCCSRSPTTRRGTPARRRCTPTRCGRGAEADLRRMAGWRDVFGGLADLHGYLGIAHALLGHKDAAVKEGQIAVALNPVTRDAIEGPRSTAQLAAIYTLIGDRDAALDRLRFLTTVLSTHWRPGHRSRRRPCCDSIRSGTRCGTIPGSMR